MTTLITSHCDHSGAHTSAGLAATADAPKNLSRADAVALVHDLFKEVGLRVLRTHRAVAQASFTDASQLPACDLYAAIRVGLDVLSDDLAAIDQVSEPARMRARLEHDFLRQRVSAALGDLDNPTFRVEGHAAGWVPRALSAEPRRWA
jgi:hypothetical protein